VQVSALGHVGHGKTTLTAAITRLLAKANNIDTYATFDQMKSGLDERVRGLVIACSRVAYTHGARHYLHADYADHADIVKGLITGYYPLDGAILVVSVLDGPPPQTREHVLLVHQVKVPALVVFLNKVDAREDQELLAVVELERRELLSKYHFPNDDVPIIRGSALNALESHGDLSHTDPAAQCIWELLEVMNTCIPTPVRAIDRPFLMPIEDVFNGKGHGIMAVGRVERGIVRVGDDIEIVGMRDEASTGTVVGIDMFQKKLKQGRAGDTIGCLLEGVERHEMDRGQLLATPGSIKPQKTFNAQVYILAQEEGGRHTPFSNGYRTCFYLRTVDIVGSVTLPDHVEKVLPGETLEILVELSMPVALEEGTRFALREGGRAVGRGICTKVKN